MLLDKTNDEIIEYLANMNHIAEHALREVLHDHPTKFRPMVLDLEDMQMRGQQIEIAYAHHARRRSALFIESCAERRAEMITMVNGMCPNATPQARAHGEQRTVPKIDGAIRDILKEAEEAGKLQRLDEGAEAVHKFFLALLTIMQTNRQYVIKAFKLNLGGQGWALFDIALVKLLNPDGTPFEKQPHDEVKDMNQDDEVHEDKSTHALESKNTTITPKTGHDEV